MALREGEKGYPIAPQAVAWRLHHATANIWRCAQPQRRTRAAIAAEIPTFSPRIPTRAAKVGILPRMQHTARTLSPVCNARNNFRKNCTIRYAKIVNAAPGQRLWPIRGIVPESPLFSKIPKCDPKVGIFPTPDGSSVCELYSLSSIYCFDFGRYKIVDRDSFCIDSCIIYPIAPGFARVDRPVGLRLQLYYYYYYF